MKYIALLRGVNVGGKNKVAMADLKKCFEEAGFSNVITYINSGNVIFDSTLKDGAELIKICEQAIEEQFGFHVICAVISAQKLASVLNQAPAWWNSGNAKHNAIFVIAPHKVEQIAKEIGDIKPEYEKVALCDPVIFWSAPIETFSRTRYSKIVGTKAYQFVTIRNAATAMKLVELSGSL